MGEATKLASDDEKLIWASVFWVHVKLGRNAEDAAIEAWKAVGVVRLGEAEDATAVVMTTGDGRPR